jgi:hypothetical protein
MLSLLLLLLPLSLTCAQDAGILPQLLLLLLLSISFRY